MNIVEAVILFMFLTYCGVLVLYMVHKEWRGFRLCPREECVHYREATKYPRKCYYEPQCWRGDLSILKNMIVRREQ